MLDYSNSLGFPLLTIILFLPVAVAIVCMFIDSFVGESEPRTRALALATVGIELLLALFMLAEFKITHDSSPKLWHLQFSDRHDWLPTLGFTFWLGVDGVSAVLVPLTTIIMGAAVVAGTYMIVENRRLFLLLMLALETAVLGVFMSANLFLYFVFWEAMLIPTYFLMGIFGEERRIYATMKFLVYTTFGSFFMLVGVLYLWTQTRTLDMAGPHGLVATLSAHPLSLSQQFWLFLAFGIAFAIKLPVFPFHSWAPTAYAESSIPVTIVLAGILGKAGAFSMVRYLLPLFPAASRELSGFVSILAVIGMLYAAWLALVQTDIKRLVAYASISHVNLIALGIFALNATSINGSVLQIVNHAVIITGLFLAVAYISSRTGTRMLQDLGGLGVSRPWLMWLFFVFVLAGLDLPGLSSFAGEFLILAGTFRTNAWFGSIGALTIILAAWYMIRFFQNTMNGQQVVAPQQLAESVEDPTRSVYEYPVVRRLIPGDLLLWEGAILVPLILLIVYIGIQPDGLTARINPTANPVANIARTAGTAASSALLGGGR